MGWGTVTRLLWQRGPELQPHQSCGQTLPVQHKSLHHRGPKEVGDKTSRGQWSEGTCISSLARFHSHPRGLTHTILGLSRRHRELKHGVTLDPGVGKGTFSIPATHHSQEGVTDLGVSLSLQGDRAFVNHPRCCHRFLFNLNFAFLEVLFYSVQLTQNIGLLSFCSIVFKIFI